MGTEGSGRETLVRQETSSQLTQEDGSHEAGMVVALGHLPSGHCRTIREE